MLVLFCTGHSNRLVISQHHLFFPMSDRFVLNCNFVQIVDPHTRICDLAIHRHFSPFDQDIRFSSRTDASLGKIFI